MISPASAIGRCCTTCVGVMQGVTQRCNTAGQLYRTHQRFVSRACATVRTGVTLYMVVPCDRNYGETVGEYASSGSFSPRANARTTSSHNDCCSNQMK